jgi:hypothetical protein
MAGFRNSPGSSDRIRRKADGRLRGKPNFLLIVVIASGMLLALLLVATLFVSWDGQHLMLKPRQAQSSSSLTLPSAQPFLLLR